VFLENAALKNENESLKIDLTLVQYEKEKLEQPFTHDKLLNNYNRFQNSSVILSYLIVKMKNLNRVNCFRKKGRYAFT
jgi:hypothetical protein